MKVPQINILGSFALQRAKQDTNQTSSALSMIEPLKQDTVSFSSTAKYLKKYNTLPEEIKKALKPKDAVDMFKNMEGIAGGYIKGEKIGQGNASRVYENPWLDDCYLLILQKDSTPEKHIVYSNAALGDAIWQDSDNNLIQIIRKAA